MKQLYVRGAQAAAAPLRATGVLDRLEQRAPRSRTAAWAASLVGIHDLDALVRLDLPWWTFDAAERVEAWLCARPGARVLEWGSGASTLWLAARAGEVHSVEHHAGWAQALAPRLPASVDLRVVEPVASPDPAVGSAKPGHAGLDFSAYVDAIDDVPGELDLVVIDGRAREACLPRALARLAPDGLVVFDNVDRRRYVDAIDAALTVDRVARSTAAPLRTTMTCGLTPALPYPTRTALLSRAPVPAGRGAGAA